MLDLVYAHAKVSSQKLIFIEQNRQIAPKRWLENEIEHNLGGYKYKQTNKHKDALRVPPLERNTQMHRSREENHASQ